MIWWSHHTTVFKCVTQTPWRKLFEAIRTHRAIYNLTQPHNFSSIVPYLMILHLLIIMQNQNNMYKSTSMKYVDHTYHDFSHYIEEGGALTKHKKSHDNFPARLHKMVSGGHDDVITWMVRLYYDWDIMLSYHVCLQCLYISCMFYYYAHHVFIYIFSSFLTIHCPNYHIAPWTCLEDYRPWASYIRCDW